MGLGRLLPRAAVRLPGRSPHLCEKNSDLRRTAVAWQPGTGLHINLPNSTSFEAVGLPSVPIAVNVWPHRGPGPSPWQGNVRK